MRTLRVLATHWKAEIAAAAEYRGDLVVGTIVSTLWLGFAVAPAIVVFVHVDTAAGWTLPRLLFVSAVWYAIDAVMWLFLMNNLSQWSERVRSGQLDVLLLKPVDSLTMASIGSIDPHNLPKLALAIGLAVVTAVVGEGPASPYAAVGGLVAVVCAGAIMWSFGVLSSVKAITSVRFDASFTAHTAHNLARVPTAFYGPTLRMILTAVVPIAFLSTVPAEVFFGARSVLFALVAVLVAAIAVAISRLAWRHQLRRYVGAMG